MTINSKFSTHQLDLQVSNQQRNFILNHGMSINYDELSIDFLDAEGQALDLQIQYHILSDKRIELILDKAISGVFQLRLKDGNSFLIKKVIIL